MPTHQSPPPAHDPTATITATAVTGQRGQRVLFTGIAFRAVAGQIVQICGRNGTGKTTLLRLIAGLGTPVRGEVTWGGAPITDCASYRHACCYLGHKTGLHAHFSACENLIFFAQLADRTTPTNRASALAALDAVGGRDYADTPCGELSAGQQQRVSLARVVASGCQLWLLDEPTTALDTPAITTLRAQMTAHTARGGIILYTSHHDLHLPAAQQLHLANDADHSAGTDDGIAA